MAERRMFAKTIIGSARFLKMPATSRLLYYDLGMDADDDGCVEAFSVMRKTGANDDDLRVLVSKGFVRILNEDLVSHILDWNVNNQIRKDRYHESAYKGLITESCDVVLLDGNQMATNGLPDGNQMATEVRLGKSSIGKGSIEEREADKPPAPAGKQARKSYGNFGWVKLTDDEYNRLLNDLGQAEVKRCIDYVDESAQTTGNKNKWCDWNLVIRKCSRDGWGLKNSACKQNHSEYTHGADRLAAMIARGDFND